MYVVVFTLSPPSCFIYVFTCTSLINKIKKTYLFYEHYGKTINTPRQF